MKIAILHYSVSPTVGGVEAVIDAHASMLLKEGFSVSLIAGTGDQAALPEGTEFTPIPEMDSRHPLVVELSQQLERGHLPQEFEALSAKLEESLITALAGFDLIIVHNIFTKHFNLPLTAALVRLLDRRKVKRCIAWCHDITWTSPHSRPSVHPGFPWDLLRTYREDLTYVTVSQHRQKELAGLFNCPLERIHVIYNGVDPADLYSFSEEGKALIEQLDLAQADLILLMPVRITQAKNIEFALQVVASLKSHQLRSKLVVTGPPDPHDPGDLQYYQSLLDLRKKLQVEREVRFVYESGSKARVGYTIGLDLLREIFRVCDILFMPSHREGFGMPVIEAGLIGMPVFTTRIPAAQEIGGQNVTVFSGEDTPDKVAETLLQWVRSNATQQLKRHIRQNYTWQAIFRQNILPMLREGAST